MANDDNNDASPQYVIEKPQISDTNGIESLEYISPQGSRKLDADEYMANDLDGVTESVFGSGSVGYASLQAAQTDAILQGQSGEAVLFDGLNINDASLPLDNDVRPIIDDVGNVDGMDLAYGDPSFSRVGSDGDYTSGTVGSISASQLSSDEGVFNNTIGDLNITNSSPRSSSQSSSFNSSQSSVVNEGNTNNEGDQGGNTENNTYNEYNEYNEYHTYEEDGEGHTHHITNIHNTVINNNTYYEGNTFIDAGDINISNILDISDVTNLIEIVLTNLNQSVDTLIEFTENVTENITSIIEDNILIDGDFIEGVVVSLQDFVQDALTQADIVNNVFGTIDTALSSTILDINTNAAVSSVVNLVEDLTQTAVTPVIDLALSQIENVFSDLNNAIDLVVDIDVENITDISVLQETVNEVLQDVTFKLVDVKNDVEDIVGDILGGGNEDTDLLVDTIGQNVGIDLIEDLVGDVDLVLSPVVDLFNTDESEGESEGDVGILGNLDLVDQDIVDTQTEIVLNPIEEIVGDVDIGAGLAADILGEMADPLVDNFVGGSGEENLISEVGDAISEVAEDLLFGDGDGDNSGDTDLDLDADLNVLDTDVVEEVADVVLDPVEDLVGDVDIALDIGADLLGSNDNSSDDTDIQLIDDIDLVDNNLIDLDEGIEIDFVEELVGDIDIDLNAAIDVLGDSSDPIIDNEDGGTGQDTLLSEVGGKLGDVVQDIIGDEIENNLEVVVNEVEEVIEDLGVDDVEAEIESLLEDVESDFADLESNLERIISDFEAVADVENSDVGDVDTLWTEADDVVSGLFDDVVSNDLSDIDILPDPTSTVAEGIGEVDVDDIIDSIGLGGLFG